MQTDVLPCHSADNDGPADCRDCDVSACVVTSWTTSRSVCRTRRTCSAVGSPLPDDVAKTVAAAAAADDDDDGGCSAMKEMLRPRGSLDVVTGRH